MKKTGSTIDIGAADAAMIAAFTAKYCIPHETVMRQRLAQFVARRRMESLRAAMPGTVLAAGHNPPPESAVRSPDEEVVFTFAAADGESVRWVARLKVPPAADAASMLPVEVEQDGAAANGVLRLAGVALPVAAGRAAIAFGAFLAGIQDTQVEFAAAEGGKSAGRLLFF